MRTRAALVLSVLSLAGLLAACGDDAESLSSEELVQRGDALCQRLADETDEVEAPASEEAFGEYLREIASLASAVREDFADLEPPADGEDVHRALLDSLDEAITATEAAAEAAEDGDTVTAEDLLQAAGDAGGPADEEARAYGFEVCGAEGEAG